MRRWLLTTSRLLGLAFSVVGTLLLGSCAHLRVLEVEVDEQVNGGYAIAFDLVIARDPRVVHQLEQLSAREWKAKQLELEGRYGAALEVHGCEWSPGAFVQPWLLVLPVSRTRGRGRKIVDLRLDNGAIEHHTRGRAPLAVFIYANYLGDGTHRRRIDTTLRSKPALRVELGPDTLTVEAMQHFELAGALDYPCALAQPEGA